MEFRPLTEELYSHCSSNKYCTDCKYRAGCPIRYAFYSKSFKTDTDFEIFIQSLELEFQCFVGEEKAFDASNSIRWKFYTERKNYPEFSYH